MYKKCHSPHEKPVVHEDADGKKTRNPNKITVNQHVIPQAHLKEWVDSRGLLSIFDKHCDTWLTQNPPNAFTVQRLWDQSMEQCTLRTNESNYQKQAALIKSSQPIDSHEHISAYFLMLCIRENIAAEKRPDSDLMMELSGSAKTQDELEKMELRNMGEAIHESSVGEGGSQSLSRDVVKIMMTMRFMKEIQEFKDVVWTPFMMSDEDAVLPDSLNAIYRRGLKILPVTPKIVLIGSRGIDESRPDPSLRPSKINDMLIDASLRYFVATAKMPRD